MDRPARVTPPTPARKPPVGPAPTRQATGVLPSMGVPKGDRPGMKVLNPRDPGSIWYRGEEVQAESDGEEVSDVGGPRELSAAERARTCIAGARTASMAVAGGGDVSTAPEAFTVAFATLGVSGLVIGVRKAVFEHLGAPRRCAVSLSVAETPLAAATTSGCGVTLRGAAGKLTGQELEAGIREYTMVQPADVPAVRRGEIVLMEFQPEKILVVIPGGDVCDVTVETFAKSAADPLASVAHGLVSHLGGDENGTLVLLCRAFGGQPGTATATMTGVDQYGVDVVAVTSGGRVPVRLNFAKPVLTSDDVRHELSALARGARFKLGVG